MHEPEPLVCAAPPAPAASATSIRQPAPSADNGSSPAVRHLVASHSGSTPAAACTAEKVALAAAATHAAVSLIKVLAAAPTEVAVPLAVSGFIVDAAALGAATATLLNCQDQAKKADPP
ncbi:MAG TPA: hypothetical protein VHB79_21295 [Polyangiaceae bacterium]|nr:hypothetical protein [Polyangiaceae bacterium]